MKRLVALVVLVIGCSPGEPPRIFECLSCPEGFHCSGDLCVEGPELRPEPPPPPIDSPCGRIANLDEGAPRVIASRCGIPMCHAGAAPFQPRFLDNVATIRNTMLNGKGTVYCQQDPYVNRKDPAKSLLLAKIEATSDKVVCPSGGDGGTRMPNAAGKPLVPGDRLPDDEIECLTWWVEQIAKQ